MFLLTVESQLHDHDFQRRHLFIDVRRHAFGDCRAVPG